MFRKNVNVNEQDVNGRTLLMRAMLEGQRRKINQLINAPHFQVNICDNTGLSVLHWSIKLGDKKTFFKLMKNPSLNITRADIVGDTPLIYATQIGDGDMIQALLQKLDDLNKSFVKKRKRGISFFENQSAEEKVEKSSEKKSKIDSPENVSESILSLSKK